ncbi:MAG: hypothetical protein ABI353_11525 [Isosphaeraceae bacterium]
MGPVYLDTIHRDWPDASLDDIRTILIEPTPPTPPAPVPPHPIPLPPEPGPMPEPEPTPAPVTRPRFPLARRAVAVILLSSLPSVAWSAEPVAAVVSPVESRTGDLVILDASQSSGDVLDWELEGSSKTFLPVEGGKRCVFASGDPGTYSFLLIAAGVDKDGKAQIAKARALVTIIGPAPPIPPVPPGPGPTPVPPGPTPIPGGEFRVVFVQESSAPMTKQEILVLGSADVRSYLNRKCAKSPSGLAEWRSWDKDVDVTNESETWKAAWAAVQPQLGALPQIVIFQGGKGTVYPLPATAAETMTLLKKYGGD